MSAASTELYPARKDLLEKSNLTTAIQIGKYQLRFEPEDIDDEFFAEKAKNELRECPEIRQQALREIRVLVANNPDLTVPDDDEFYEKFLRPCKWYPKSAYEVMERFYKFRLSHRRVCEDLLPSKERNVFCSGVLTPLPLRNGDGCRILLIESGKKWKPKEVSLDEMFKATMLSLDAAMAEPRTQVSGIRAIIDMDGLSLSQVTYFTPSFASMVVEWVQKCLPSRIKGIHVINQPYVFKMVFAFFKPFLQEKLRKRIIFHGADRESLKAHISANALPKKYGGELDIPDEPIGEALWKYFCSFEDDFIVSNKCGYKNKT
ncbi:alpha-tocopherol transfer protein-like isoform X2 [Prorops nasuta]